jgi:hypothetical protein
MRCGGVAAITVAGGRRPQRRPLERRLTESYDVDRPLPKPVSWMTEKWVGSQDRGADLRDGMEHDGEFVLWFSPYTTCG